MDIMPLIKGARIYRCYLILLSAGLNACIQFIKGHVHEDSGELSEANALRGDELTQDHMKVDSCATRQSRKFHLVVVVVLARAYRL